MKGGIAYGFFNCRADSPQVIEATLPSARHASQAPSDLELSVIDGVDNLPSDTLPTIRDIALHEAQPKGIRYVMEARLPGATNEQTAVHLIGVLNMIYNEPSIHLHGDRPGRLILYVDETTGDVLSRE